MSDTPKTDAEIARPHGGCFDDKGDFVRLVTADFARQLERELRAYQAAAEKVLAACSKPGFDPLISAIRDLRITHTQSRPRAEGEIKS